MGWVDNIRKKPQEQKIRLVWLVVVITAIILIGLWIILYRYEKHLPVDTTIFQTINKGLQDVKDSYKK